MNFIFHERERETETETDRQTDRGRERHRESKHRGIFSITKVDPDALLLDTDQLGTLLVGLECSRELANPQLVATTTLFIIGPQNRPVITVKLPRH